MANTDGFIALAYDELGKEIIKRVNWRLEGTNFQYSISNHHNTPASEAVVENQPVSGSNLFRMFVVDSVARGFEKRIILPRESELIIGHRNDLETTITYRDLGLLIDFSGKNHELAVELYNQLDRENRQLEMFPALLTGLKVVKSRFGNYGLGFELSDYFSMIEAKIFSQLNGKEKFECDDDLLVESGLPSRLGMGERILSGYLQNSPCIENLGLTRFSSSGHAYLSSYSILDNSNSHGRFILTDC